MPVIQKLFQTFFGETLDIRDLVQLGNRQAGAFSKYAASRAFG